MLAGLVVPGLLCTKIHCAASH